MRDQVSGEPDIAQERRGPAFRAVQTAQLFLEQVEVLLAEQEITLGLVRRAPAGRARHFAGGHGQPPPRMIRLSKIMAQSAASLAASRAALRAARSSAGVLRSSS